MDREKDRQAHPRRSPTQELPSYDETVRGEKGDNPFPTRSTSSGNLTNRLAEVQTSHLRDVIERRIMPLVLEHVETGLFCATFVLIPDGTLENHSTYTVLNFPEDEDVRIVRLESDAHDGRFWRQQRVIALMEQNLREELIASGIGLKTRTVPEENTKAMAAGSVSRSRFSFWRKELSGGHKSRMFSNGDDCRDSGQQLNDSNASLSVGFEEIRVRVTTDMGLYETIGCAAIVVRLRIGGLLQC